MINAEVEATSSHKMSTDLEDLSKDPNNCANMKQEISHRTKRLADEEEGHSLKVSKVEDSGASEIYRFVKKLLMTKSPDMADDWKRLSEMKEKYGASFARKIEGVFNDTVESKSLMDHFKKNKEAENIPLEIYVNVLRQAYWPSHLTELHLPSSMVITQQLFADFYKKKYNKRKLEWVPRLSYCLLKAAFPKGRKDLLVSLLQALVLLLFNDADELTLDEIKSRTNIGESELKNTLQSLACGKARVLHQHPRGKEVCDGNSFSFNKDFIFKKLYRIKMIPVNITDEEQQQLKEPASQQYKQQVDVAIVKVMKSKQVIDKDLLVSAVQSQLKCPAEPEDIQKRIEALIDLNYLEYSKENNNSYCYIT
ncbi:cullin-4B-like [Penaeus monodon]|uniref:cullin-4B-like n=1 Tax=Penaeus monodon TaxID=6687 RepID=UPI0018A6F4A1|nr:cullin-4B-like [Penaeus monodon]